MIWARRGLWPKMRSKTVNRFPCYPHPSPPPDLIFSHILNQCALYGLIENTMWGSNKRIERGLILLIWIRHLSNVSSALMNVFWMSLMGYVNKTGKGGFQRLACKKMVTSCLWFPGRWRSVGGGGYTNHIFDISLLCRVVGTRSGLALRWGLFVLDWLISLRILSEDDVKERNTTKH